MCQTFQTVWRGFGDGTYPTLHVWAHYSCHIPSRLEGVKSRFVIKRLEFFDLRWRGYDTGIAIYMEQI